MAILSRHHGITGFCLLLAYSFQVYFKSNEDRFTNIRRNKNILAVVISICGCFGFVMAISGFTNLYGKRLEYDFTPVLKQARHNYLLLAIVGLLFIIASILGYYGVCERKNIFAKAYLMVSTIFGLGLLHMYFVWLILDVILTPDYEVTGKGIVKLERSPNEVKNARYYMSLMLLAALLQICCAILIFLVLYKYRKIRGYIAIDENEADFVELLDVLRKKRRYFDESFI